MLFLRSYRVNYVGLGEHPTPIISDHNRVAEKIGTLRSNDADGNENVKKKKKRFD